MSTPTQEKRNQKTRRRPALGGYFTEVCHILSITMQFHRTWFTNLCSPACSQRVFTSAVHHIVWFTTFVHHFGSPRLFTSSQIFQNQNCNRGVVTTERNSFVIHGTHCCGTPAGLLGTVLQVACEGLHRLYSV